MLIDFNEYLKGMMLFLKVVTLEGGVSHVHLFVLFFFFPENQG